MLSNLNEVNNFLWWRSSLISSLSSVASNWDNRFEQKKKISAPIKLIFLGKTTTKKL